MDCSGWLFCRISIFLFASTALSSEMLLNWIRVQKHLLISVGTMDWLCAWFSCSLGTPFSRSVYDLARTLCHSFYLHKRLKDNYASLLKRVLHCVASVLPDIAYSFLEWLWIFSDRLSYRNSGHVKFLTGPALLRRRRGRILLWNSLLICFRCTAVIWFGQWIYPGRAIFSCSALTESSSLAV